MYEDITEQSLSELSTKFQNNTQKLADDIHKTFVNDDKDERKKLEKQLQYTQAVLTNIRKLRNLIASRNT